MSNRPTITIALPFNHTLSLHEYITGYEWEELVEIYRDGKAKGEDDKAVALHADKRLYEILAVTVDGSTDDPYTAVRNLPKPAYDLAVTVIVAAMNGEKVDEYGKKKSETSSLNISPTED